MKRLLLFALLAIPAISFAQEIPHDSLWAPMRYFIGSWVGSGEGESGTGHYERNYQWALNGNFIQIRNKAAYAPQPKSPQGEIHEDIGYVNYNSLEKKFMLRQFHVEGFVNEYKLESISSDRKKFVFLSFEIENLPTGWRARETYQILSVDEYVETFELAAPGKDFILYSKATMKRRKPRYNG
jgi:hypothetical protein